MRVHYLKPSLNGLEHFHNKCIKIKGEVFMAQSSQKVIAVPMELVQKIASIHLSPTSFIF